MESLARIAEEIEQLAQEGAVFRGDRAALERWGVLAREWRALPAALVEAHSAQAEAVRLLESRLAEREAEARVERERRQRNNLSRLEQFCGETEAMLSASPALKDVSRRQRQIQSLLENPPTLPTKLDQDAVIERLKGLQARLGPQLQELREIDDWERWANVGVQEELCARVEALGSVTDPAVIARELRDIEQRWRQASAVPREKAQALWRRYRTGARCGAGAAQRALRASGRRANGKPAPQGGTRGSGRGPLRIVRLDSHGGSDSAPAG